MASMADLQKIMDFWESLDKVKTGILLVRWQ